eukprot:1749988-Pleurochrysis_carterae.AAC.10
MAYLFTKHTITILHFRTAGKVGGDTLASRGRFELPLTIYHDMFALPEAGIYNFTVYDNGADGLCCAYGDGGVALLVDDELVFSGQNFGAKLEYRFSLPLPSHPAPPPAQPQTPPAPPAPPCAPPAPPAPPSSPSYVVDVLLLTDSFPEETSWQIVNESGVTIAANGPFSRQHTWYNTSQTLQSGSYNLYIVDIYGDGMDDGKWALLFDDITFASDESFEYYKRVPFQLPFQPTVEPVQRFQVDIQIYTDNFPEETTWKLMNTAPGLVVAAKGPFSTPMVWVNTTLFIEYGLYTLSFYDSYGDSLAWPGRWLLHVDGMQIAAGGMFTGSTHVPFQLPLASPPPVAPPSPPMAPSPPTVRIGIAVFTDSYPSETSWKLVNTATFVVVAARGPFPDPLVWANTTLLVEYG